MLSRAKRVAGRCSEVLLGSWHGSECQPCRRVLCRHRRCNSAFTRAHLTHLAVSTESGIDFSSRANFPFYSYFRIAKSLADEEGREVLSVQQGEHATCAARRDLKLDSTEVFEHSPSPIQVQAMRAFPYPSDSLMCDTAACFPPCRTRALRWPSGIFRSIVLRASFSQRPNLRSSRRDNLAGWLRSTFRREKSEGRTRLGGGLGGTPERPHNGRCCLEDWMAAKQNQ